MDLGGFLKDPESPDPRRTARPLCFCREKVMEFLRIVF